MILLADQLTSFLFPGIWKQAMNN